MIKYQGCGEPPDGTVEYSVLVLCRAYHAATGIWPNPVGLKAALEKAKEQEKLCGN